jgi:hypothetical protein
VLAATGETGTSFHLTLPAGRHRGNGNASA